MEEKETKHILCRARQSGFRPPREEDKSERMTKMDSLNTEVVISTPASVGLIVALNVSGSGSPSAGEEGAGGNYVTAPEHL